MPEAPETSMISAMRMPDLDSDDGAPGPLWPSSEAQQAPKTPGQRRRRLAVPKPKLTLTATPGKPPAR